jgi:hypothetical protein
MVWISLLGAGPMFLLPGFSDSGLPGASELSEYP